MKREPIRRRAGALAVVAAFVGVAASAFADIILVPRDYPTIQQAIDVAVDGDEIIVSPGEYGENVNFLNKDIIVRSTDPTDVRIVVDTAINGNPNSPVVTLSKGTICGFTIRFGEHGVLATDAAEVCFNRIYFNNSEFAGGGVRATDNAFVHDNLIRNNSSPSTSLGGGGVYAQDLVVVMNNTIMLNHTGFGQGAQGGGVWAQGQALITGNVITENDARFGGGVYLFGGARAVGNEISCNTADAGGGVFARSTSTLVAENLIRDNEAENSGGGVLARDFARVHDNEIIDNVVTDGPGGGVAARDDAVIDANRILGNTIPVPEQGGGVDATGNVEVKNNLISGNNRMGVYCDGSGEGGLIVFRNNTVVGNDGGGLLVSYSVAVSSNVIAFGNSGTAFTVGVSSLVTADYNIIYSPGTALLGGNAAAVLAAGEGNLINVDPLLDVDGVHLTPDSPCANAGDPDLVPATYETDIDGQLRIVEDRVDIGADEFAEVGDLDGDGVVNAADLAILLGWWGPCTWAACEFADLNGDGNVNAADLAILLGNWG